jgi:hypothetical protein
MAKTPTASRAPRGTKILAQAFFAAADKIPQARRGEVVKAALAAIRDELKGARETTAAAKAKGRAATSKPPVATPSRKAVGRPQNTAKAPKEAALTPVKTRKTSAKRGRKVMYKTARNGAVSAASSPIAETPVQS